MGEYFSVRMFCGAVYGYFRVHLRNSVQLFLSSPFQGMALMEFYCRYCLNSTINYSEHLIYIHIFTLQVFSVTMNLRNIWKSILP